MSSVTFPLAFEVQNDLEVVTLKKESTKVCLFASVTLCVEKWTI